MGTWSVDAYGNDDALMWINELLKSQSPLKFIDTTLNLIRGDNPDAIDCRRAIAASELIALRRGHSARDVPDELRDWCGETTFPTSAVAKKAIKTMRQISRQSELLELWEEDRQAWLTSCRRTIERLSRPQKKKSAATKKLPPSSGAKLKNEAIKLLRKNNWFIFYENRKPQHAGMDSNYKVSLKLFEAVAHLQSLEWFSVMDATYECKKPMDPEWMQYLLPLPRLKQLDFEGDRVTDDYLNLIDQFPNLTDIALHTTKVSDNGLQKIARCRSLAKIELWSCPELSLAGIKTLENRFPNADLIYGPKSLYQ